MADEPELTEEERSQLTLELNDVKRELEALKRERGRYSKIEWEELTEDHRRSFDVDAANLADQVRQLRAQLGLSAALIGAVTASLALFGGSGHVDTADSAVRPESVVVVTTTPADRLAGVNRSNESSNRSSITSTAVPSESYGLNSEGLSRYETRSL